MKNNNSLQALRVAVLLPLLLPLLGPCCRWREAEAAAGDRRPLTFALVPKQMNDSFFRLWPGTVAERAPRR